jgi:hypothetical protein
VSFAVVSRVGLAFSTQFDSFGELHGLVAAVLWPSPE